MRTRLFILLLLVLSVRQGPLAHAQVPANLSPDQMMQLMRAQPGINISAPVVATAEFDPPLVEPGEKAVYRVRLNATAISVKWPEKIPAPAGLKIHLNCSGQTMEAADGGIQNFATFDYDVSADAAGQFTLPEFAVEVYGKPVAVPAAQLEVKANLPASHEPLRQLLVKPSATNVFIGEPFDVSVLLPATASGSIGGVSEIQLNGGSFVVNKNAVRQSFRPLVINGRQVTTYFYETSVTPIASGKITLSAQGFTVGAQPNGVAKLTLLDSEPVAIEVRPLPAGRELPGFMGAIGNCICDPPSLSTNLLTVGEPVQLKIVVRGEKDFSRTIPPLPPRAEGWQIFPAVRGDLTGGGGGPGVTFKYTLIPLTDALKTTPPFPFSCFDPARSNYVDLTIPPLPVTVVVGSTARIADSSLMLSENAGEPERKSGLSQLAVLPGWTTGNLKPLQLRVWFSVVQILPALGFCGLWFWDRRRRFLEQHPEIVRRHEAYRALRREMRLLDQAIARGDAANFVRCAINGLQIASAPHYPATPRAMVCGDVLQILTETERDGETGQTVRRFFAAANTKEFTAITEDLTGLLGEKTALKEILVKLEARL